MNPNKDHYNLRGRVPFSWEKMQAWVGKGSGGGQHSAEETGCPLLLPPPPSRRWSLESSKAAAAHGIPIRLPLWASERPPRSSASNKKNKKGEQEEEDPFMLALSECTRSPQQRQQRRIKKKVSVRIKKISIKIRSLSCRQLSSCAVAGVDNFYTAGRPPHNPNDPRHRKGEEKRLLTAAFV